MDKKELEEILARHAKNTDYKLEIIADDVGTIKEGVSYLQDDVSGLKKDVFGLKNDVSGLKNDVSDLKEDVVVLKEDVAVLKEGVADLTGKVDVIFEQTSQLTVDIEMVKGSVQRHEQKINQQ